MDKDRKRPARKVSMSFLSKSTSKSTALAKATTSKTMKPVKVRKVTLRRSLSYDTIPRMKHKNVICQPLNFQRRAAPHFKDYNNQHLVLICLSFISFTSMLALSIIAPFFPIEAANKGMTNSVIGLVFGSFSMVMMASSPMISLVIPRIGPKLTLLLGVLVCGTSNILFGLLDRVHNQATFTALCFIVRSAEAIGATAFSTATYVILMLNDEYFNVSTAFSIIETSVGLGLSLGPAIGGFLYSFGGYPLPFFILGGLQILNLPLCLMIIQPDGDNCDIVKSPMRSYLNILKIVKININGIVIIIVAMLISFLDPTLEPHMRTIGLTPTYVSLIFLIMSATYTVSSPIVGYLSNGVHNKFKLMTIGLLLLAIEFLFLGPAEFIGLTTSFTQTSIIMAFVGISYSIAFIPTFETLLDLALKHGFPDDVSTYSLVSGVWSSFCSFGEILGPVFGGMMVEKLGFPKASTIMGILALLTGILCIVMCIYSDDYESTPTKEEVEEKKPLKLKSSHHRKSNMSMAGSHGHANKHRQQQHRAEV